MTALKGILRVGRDVLIIVLITVALGELSLRIYNSIDPLPIFYSESYNQFRGKPFARDWNFHLNSRGSHWNIAGNALATRLILQHLSAQLRPVDK